MPLLSEQNRRKRNLLIIAAFLVLLGGLSALDMGIIAPELPVASNIVIFALFNLNLIVFLLLLVLLFRNLVKLYDDRRHKVLGSKFKFRLVFSFIVLAVAPAIVIFVIASNFIDLRQNVAPPAIDREAFFVGLSCGSSDLPQIGVDGITDPGRQVF